MYGKLIIKEEKFEEIIEKFTSTNVYDVNILMLQNKHNGQKIFFECGVCILDQGLYSMPSGTNLNYFK